MKKHQHLIITGVITLLVGLGLGYWGATAFAQPATRSAGLSPVAPAPRRRAASRVVWRTGDFSPVPSPRKIRPAVFTINTAMVPRLVLVTPNTTVSKSVTGSLFDVTTGSTIIVSGTTNSDGSVSANLIQLRPSMPMPTATPAPIPN